MKTYDSIVIGAGQSGPFLAAKLEGKGEKVAVAEGYKIGGSCVNYGCIPTKTIIASARVAHMARRGPEYGVMTGEVKVDMDQVISRKQERVDGAQGGMDGWIRGLEGIDIYDKFASFEGSDNGLHHIRVGASVIASEKIFINTGAHTFIPPINGLNNVDYLTNREILNLRKLPDHLMILGGGYIALEMGQAFRRFGADVTIIEAAPTIISREDDDLIESVRGILENEGIRVLEGCKAVQAEQANDGTIRITVEDSSGGKSIVSGSHFLVAVGRRPNSEKLNLGAVGVNTDARGYIQVDDHLRTNVEGIWATGDVNGRGAFTHTSYQDFEVVWDNLNGGDRKLDRIMAYALYIDPPLGRVGMSEKEARGSGKNILMATRPMSHIGRALEQGETQGLIKMLVDADTEQIVGAAALGYHGDDVIQIISYFMYTGASYKVMQNALPIHPTVGELLPTILGQLQPLA